MRKGKFNWDVILYSTDCDFYPYEEYVEWCEENGTEPSGEDSEEFYKWMNEEMQMYWEDFVSNIKHCEFYNKPVLVEGRLGLWYGARNIVPTEMDSVYDAIMQCINSADVMTIKYVKGYIEVTAIHHDGTNSFVIRDKDRRKKLPYLFAI